MKIREILVAVIFAQMIFAGFINAQEKEKLHTFNFYLINGLALSYNFHESENSMWRLHLDFSNSYSTTKKSYDNYSSGSVSNSDFTDDQIVLSISISTPYIMDLYKTELGAIYWGIGPFVSYTLANSTGESSLINNGVENTNNTTEKTYSFSGGGKGIVGIKANVKKNISLFVETHINAGYSYKKQTYETESINDNNKYKSNSSGENKTWFYNLDLIRLGISVGI